MGTVFKAEQAASRFSCIVAAFKIIKIGMDTDQVIARASNLSGRLSR